MNDIEKAIKWLEDAAVEYGEVRSRRNVDPADELHSEVGLLRARARLIDVIRGRKADDVLRETTWPHR